MEVRNLIRSLRRDLDVAHRNYVLRRAFSEFSRNPSAHIDAADTVLLDMVWGWNNESWSATAEYLSASLEHASRSPGPILECGSGLTTIALGLLCQSRGNTVWSLEHDPEWAEKVKKYLAEYEISSVKLTVCELKSYSGFDWYNPSADGMPAFSLVICDGPPAGVTGGRYGLIPVMRTKLAPGAVILLDDAERSEEQEIASRWAAELGTTFSALESEQPFMRLIIP